MIIFECLKGDVGGALSRNRLHDKKGCHEIGSRLAKLTDPLFHFFLSQNWTNFQLNFWTFEKETLNLFTVLPKTSFAVK